MEKEWKGASNLARVRDDVAAALHCVVREMCRSAAPVAAEVGGRRANGRDAVMKARAKVDIFVPIYGMESVSLVCCVGCWRLSSKWKRGRKLRWLAILLACVGR